MRTLLTILLFPFFIQAQTTVNINGSGTTVNINGSGTAVTINYVASPNTNPYIPSDYGGIINNTLQNLTASYPDSFYYGFPMTYGVGQKRAIVFRRGTIHGEDATTSMMRLETSNGANTWVMDSIFSETGYDVRNYGGGSTSQGVVLIFYGRLNSAGVWVSNRCMRSVNGGATFTHSADLELADPSITVFSPHGRLVELDNGDLLQSFYGWSPTVYYVWTLKSTDQGLTWGSPVSIYEGSIFINEASLVNLGAGKLIAGIRYDVGDTEKDLYIYNSDDSGASWDSIGICTYLSAADLPGTSPLLIRKDADNATIVSTARRQYNAFVEVTLPFGSAVTTGIYRSFYEGMPQVGVNNNFGYPALLSFNSNEQDQMIAFYDISSEYVSGAVKTDIYVNPIFRRVQSISEKTSGTIATGGAFIPAVYIVDELTVYNGPTDHIAYHKIRTAGDYSIRVEATFTGTGSSRDLNVRRYTSAQVLVGTMYTESGSGNTYDFTTTQTMAAGELILLQVVHDASPLTVTNLKMTITKL